MKKHYNTSCVEYDCKKYCLYCGKEIEVVEDCYGNHGRDVDYYYPCDCNGAKEEQLLLERLADAKNQLKAHIEKAKSDNKMVVSKKDQEEKIKNLMNNSLSRAKLITLDQEKA